MYIFGVTMEVEGYLHGVTYHRTKYLLDFVVQIWLVQMMALLVLPYMGHCVRIGL